MSKSNICKDFMHDNCKYGDKCKFIHDKTICFHWWKYDTCKYGDKCHKKHYIELKNIRNIKNIRNTTCFEPKLDPVDMRIVLDMGSCFDKCSTKITPRDVMVVPNLFIDYAPGELYRNLVDEIMHCGIHPDKLLKMWHGNDKIEGTHMIVDDKTNWKELCPTFEIIINRIKNFFNMRIEATRFNWYKDTSQWKPFHHDASALKPDKAAIQNFTVALSLGATRDAAFEHANNKTVISLPQSDGQIYCFAKDTNIIWKHGILQEKEVRDIGRISIICWGSIKID